jgi:hypothetical protein
LEIIKEDAEDNMNELDEQREKVKILSVALFVGITIFVADE